MTKPHEETWTFEPPNSGNRGAVLLDEWESAMTLWRTDHHETESDTARHKLAAQAPAMARLLLSLMPGTAEPLWPDTLDEIEAVLRAAGVLP